MIVDLSIWRPWLALMRFDRPVGSLLLLWPTLAALWVAAEGMPPAVLIAVFTLGVFIMRAAGCVINDLADRRFDPLVARTRNRPLATGAISVRGALGLLAGLCLVALALLAWLNAAARWLAVAGLAISVLYPFTKRWTHLPQVVLGAAFSWGIVMAFAAVSGGVPATGWLFFVASLLWIVAYDTLYAMVDREDDLKAGIKSTAILFGAQDRLMVGVLQAGAWFGFALLGWRSGFGAFYGAGLAVIVALFVHQQILIRARDRDRCFRAFLNNTWVGFALFAAVVAESSFDP
ncbi:MAG: 4-hydroxybenzoate octaprenyltransferase [Gammaproteobacteria bacterium]|nr:4-hydroxybenzoate octaprenyltransferase [Gammaproteobacteria bacterium]